MLEIRLHGYGGEGIVTLAQLIAAAALKTGKQVQTMPSFGVERRGAPVLAAVRISDEEIWTRSQSYSPDLLLVLNKKLLDTAIEQGIKEDSLIILNAPADTVIEEIHNRRNIKKIDITGLAVEGGLILRGAPTVNIPSFGAVGYAVGLPLEKIEEVILEKWPGKIGAKNAAIAAVAYQTMQGRG
ncbi:MAG: 2-oxoacid:acceptor oxidoreductase family protein [Bacillota bacterium]|jgi:2-oxoacid:acceptor oxidoreductase gamma subunit (pyruvate/2-ketoisovalerate family)